MGFGQVLHGMSDNVLILAIVSGWLSALGFVLGFGRAVSGSWKWWAE